MKAHSSCIHPLATKTTKKITKAREKNKEDRGHCTVFFHVHFRGGSSWRNSGGGGGHYASGANSVSLGSRDTNQMNGYGSQQQTSYYSV